METKKIQELEGGLQVALVDVQQKALQKTLLVLIDAQKKVQATLDEARSLALQIQASIQKREEDLVALTGRISSVTASKNQAVAELDINVGQVSELTAIQERLARQILETAKSIQSDDGALPESLEEILTWAEGLAPVISTPEDTTTVIVPLDTASEVSPDQGKEDSEEELPFPVSPAETQKPNEAEPEPVSIPVFQTTPPPVIAPAPVLVSEVTEPEDPVAIIEENEEQDTDPLDKLFLDLEPDPQPVVTQGHQMQEPAAETEPTPVPENNEPASTTAPVVTPPTRNALSSALSWVETAFEEAHEIGDDLRARIVASRKK